jgi:hypothetical protein
MLRWPLREILRGYRVIAREEALETYRIQHLEYVIQQLQTKERIRPPQTPKILEG